MDKRILLPTDFSKNSLNAVHYALDLYSGKECSIYFLNVYPIDGLANRSKLGEHFHEIEKRKAEEVIEKLMEMLRMHYKNPDHTYHTIVTYGSLLEGVKDAIAKNDIDIIIMGTKGLGESNSTVFGTNTISMMENVTECPVLAIPEDVRFAPPKEIVFPTDYKITFKRRELKYMINISQTYNALIRVFHVKRSAKLNRVQRENKDLLSTIFRDVGHSFHELEGMSVQAGINAFIDSRASDMVSFINRKHILFGSILSTPLVKELGHHSKVPVLVLKDRT